MSDTETQPKHDVFLFFGVVGAGKGTQIELLKKYLDEQGRETLYMYPGAKFRQLMSSGSYVGKYIADSLNAGNLQPSFLADTMTIEAIIEDYKGTQDLIFDGYPRRPQQSKTFHGLREFFGWSVPTIIFINISEDEAFRRLESRGRDDDSKEGIVQRIKEYKNNVLPSLDDLRGFGEYKYVEINGEQSVEDVHADILAALGFK